MAKKSMAMTITEKKTKQSKAGARSASLPSALPALQMPKLKTPAKTSGTQMPVLGKTTSKGIGIVQSVANGSGTQSSGRTTAPKVKTVKPAQQSATDRAANIRAFGAGDYSGGGEPLEKAYKTARAAVKGIGSSYANIGGSAVEGMGNLQEIMQKGENDKKIQQMKDNKAFYEQALKTGVNPRTGKKLTVDERSRYYKILNTQYTDGKIAQMENVYKDATANQKARTMEAANAAFAASDRLKASADKDVAAAKEGSGKVGQFLVDLGYTGTQLLADTAANAIAPGAGMVSMASRVYGDASAEARREGKTAGQQALSGLKGATIEALTEKLFGGLAKAYGAGTADELVEKVADKLTKTEAGQRAAVWLINSGGEGLEEVVSDVLNPLADRALGLDDGTGAIFTTDDAAQMAYDFLLGGTMGLIGSSGQLRRGRTVQMPTLERTQDAGTVEMPQFATEPTAQDAQTAPGVNFDAETQNAAERLTEPNTAAGKITMPRVTDAAGNTYAQRRAAATFNDGTKSDAEGVLGLLRSNIPALEGIEPVANVTGQEVGKTGRATDRVYNFFQSIGGKVRREGFGDVLFSKSRVRNSVVGHGSGEAKIQLAAAVPGVIENGVQINYTPNWKGRGYDSYVFAAPVTYDGKQTYVTAIVTKDDANRYYLHEALDAEGNVLYKKAEGYDAASDRPTATPQDTIADIEPSIDSIAQTEGAVNEVEIPVIGENAAAEVDAYMDALAQDENIFTNDPYTPADAVYDARLRRLQESGVPPAAEREQILQADLDELASLYADQADMIGRREYLQDATSDMVTSNTAPKKQSGREAASEAWDFFYRKMVDAGHSVTKLSEAVDDPYLYQFYNQARASSSAGVNMITDAQTDVRGRKVGDSLNDVFSPIRARGDDLYHDFQLYMFDLHNIDRMSLSEGRTEKVLEATAALRDFDAENPGIRTDTAAQLRRLTEDPDPDIAALARERERLLRNLDKAEAIQDKPVFDYEFSAEDSHARAEKLLAQHPEFAEYQARVRKYIDNMMQYRVDSGLMTQENADFLKEFYPNYVPTMRVQDKNAAGRGRDLNAVRIGKTVGRAQGGTERLVPLHEALGKQTMKVVREGSKNRFADRLLRDYLRTGDTDAVNRYVKEANQYEHEFSPETLDDAAIERPSKDKIVTAYMDGKLWEMTVDDTLFDAVKALSPDTAESNKLTRVARGANNLFKSLVTGYNPTFLARNVIRDLQTAGLNTRDAAAFARNYPRALAEIKNNGEYWQLYKALGGVYSSVFDYTTGTVKEPKGRMGKVMARVEALNMAAEQAPRLAEFMGVMQEAEAAKQRGEAVSDLAAEADALYAAADITVNFGRSGSLGKVLNANYVPFLNPGVQGLDKLVRRVTETKGAKEWTKLAARAVALGIAPSLLNALLYHDDDEWDDLRDSDKDTNYMFKLGNGYWLKIPKGRELSLLGITADRVADAVRGEDVDILSTINTMGNQVAPANPLTSNIFSALIDSQLLNPDSPGRTWYGGDIESQRLQNYAPGERYDSSTDVFSKAVGKALGISPKKLNYVLDQYSGVLGDFLLPVLTPQAERGMFEKAFTVDAMSSNRVSGDFYDEANELKYAKNAGDVASGVVSRWWNKQQTACSDLWKQIREVEASTELSDSEKKQQTRELKAIVTGIQKNAIAQEDVFRTAVESHLAAGEDEDTAYREANKDCFGAEYALQVYNKDVYERAQDAKENGVPYDDFYTYYFGTKGIKATSTESAVSQKFDYLQRSGISEEAQAEIYFADMASDKTLLTQAQLEMSAGITAAQYYNYKAATSSMSKKAEKLEVIAAMDLTSEQKDALYYSEGWAESKIYEAPWRSGRSAGVSMPVLGGSGVTMPVLGSRESSGVQMPVLK